MSRHDHLQLTGITWDHSRGYVPLVATAQRWSEKNPGVEIVWHKRSLKAFGDQPLEELAPRFDLLVVDHPFVGYAAAHQVLLPLNDALPAEFIADQGAHSVGASFHSYVDDDSARLWALPIDAATPVSAWRPDLLAEPPQSWDDLLALARTGRVALPAVPIDSLMHWYMLVLGLGETPFAAGGLVVRADIGAAALEHLRELVLLCDAACLERNPIGTLEALADGDRLAYCPFAYGYSNYARPGYAANVLRFGGLVRFEGTPLRSTLGGTGLAISHACRDPEAALAYAQYVAGADCQRGLYFQAGGQPGHRGAWEDATVNAASNGFFRDTLPTLDAAFLRPRYDGYMQFQDRASLIVHDYLRRGGDVAAAAQGLNMLFAGRRTRRG